MGFAAAVGEPPGEALDLGSGGGVPGLVLAAHWPTSFWVLLDTDRRCTGFLDRAVLELGWSGRVEVLHARAETAGRDQGLRGRFDLVCARSFGPPAVVAECAAPFLALDGRLVVSDPPSGAQNRWPTAGVSALGLAVQGHSSAAAHFTMFRQAAPCPDRYPRRPGVPARRLLF